MAVPRGRSALRPRGVVRAVGRLISLVVIGFTVGLVFGLVTEEPELLARHLGGESEAVALREVDASADSETGAVEAGAGGIHVRGDLDASACGACRTGEHTLSSDRSGCAGADPDGAVSGRRGRARGAGRRAGRSARERARVRGTTRCRRVRRPACDQHAPLGDSGGRLLRAPRRSPTRGSAP